MLEVKELENRSWYIGEGRGAKVAKWYEESLNSGLFISIRYSWYGGREWPVLNSGHHRYYGHGGDFKPFEKIEFESGSLLERKEIKPLAYYKNSNSVGRWFPDPHGGHFKVADYDGKPVVEEYSFDEFKPMFLAYKPEMLTVSARKKIGKNDISS